jgi:hypothetical protein
MTLTFPDGTALSINGFGLLAITIIVFIILMCTNEMVEIYLKDRRRE